MVVFGQSGSFREKMVVVVFLKKCLYSLKSCCIRAILFYSGKVVVIGHFGCIRAKVATFGQSGSSLATVLVFGQKWLYSGRNFFIRAKWLYFGRVVVFGQKRL